MLHLAHSPANCTWHSPSLSHVDVSVCNWHCFWLICVIFRFISWSSGASVTVFRERVFPETQHKCGRKSGILRRLACQGLGVAHTHRGKVMWVQSEKSWEEKAQKKPTILRNLDGGLPISPTEASSPAIQLVGSLGKLMCTEPEKPSSSPACIQFFREKLTFLWLSSSSVCHA